MENSVRKLGPLRRGNLVLIGLFLFVLLGIFSGYKQVKGPFTETEIQEAQSGATRFLNGELEIGQGQLIDIKHYFFVGTVYEVETAQGRKNLISFVTPQDKPSPGQKVEWVGVDNYVSYVTTVFPEERIMDGEINSLERISPKNNDQFYCVVYSFKEDTVQRFIVDAAKLATLKTLNSVQVTYHSPGDSIVELVPNTQKVATGYITDLWLTTMIKGLELERDFDFEKYPYYITLAPRPNAKYTWTFYLTKEQRDLLKNGNVLEVKYSSIFPSSIVVTRETVDPDVLWGNPDNGEKP
ncbi:hypothetical protein [Desulfosporosinus nitroreducens]|uniref:Uncharacterized protein n=1 Tax=Desulfosporosinus nitroreducens TaxID=2018668 RepID=A0ABT8QLP6_9FIRM|nr:hypothetical protein [Desulfosporosinus nitroreducens]MCO1603218.1 hypothetical protein [Desulfosporosinus nitroreducens]MDO0822221.1 hypothetical protein [Desulfosporosinus nitroreducens]